MSSNIRLGIALYNSRHSPTGGRHWALIVNPTQNTLAGRVSIFQAVMRDNVWSLKHLEGSIIQDEYYHGVVDLGTIRGSPDIIFDAIESFGSGQDGYYTYEREWSCAWWVMRAFRKIQSYYRLNIDQSDVDLYNRVTVRLANLMANARSPLYAVGVGQ